MPTVTFVPEIAPGPVPTYRPEGVVVSFVPVASKFSVRLSPVIGMRPLIEGLMERLAPALRTLPQTKPIKDGRRILPTATFTEATRTNVLTVS